MENQYKKFGKIHVYLRMPVKPASDSTLGVNLWIGPYLFCFVLLFTLGLNPSVAWATLFGVKLFVDSHVASLHQELDHANSLPFNYQPEGHCNGRAGPK